MTYIANSLLDNFPWVHCKQLRINVSEGEPPAPGRLCLLMSSCLNKYHLCPPQFFMLEIWDIAWLLTFSHTSLKSITNKFLLIVSLISWKLTHLFLSIFQLPSLSLFKKLLSFDRRIIALQCCVDFCHTSTWVSHRNMHVPFPLNLPPNSDPIPPL